MIKCDFCGVPKHTKERCFEWLQVEGSGRCPRCSQSGHHWKKCPSAMTLTCSFCKMKGHSRESCFHLRKVINNRIARTTDSNRRLSAAEDTNWRQRDHAVASAPSSVPKNWRMRRAISTSSVAAGTQQQQQQQDGNNNSEVQIENKVENVNNVPRNDILQKTDSDQQATLSIGTDGRLTIQANANQLVQLLSGLKLKSTDSEAVHSEENNAAAEPTLLHQLFQLAEQSLEKPEISTQRTENIEQTASAVNVSPSVRPKEKSPVEKSSRSETVLSEENYMDMLQLYNNDLWPTFSPFRCPVCHIDIDSFGGVVLKNCQIHKTCRECLRVRILDAPFKEVTCPEYAECMATLTEPEINEILVEENDKMLYEQKRSREQAEGDKSLLQPYLYDHDLMPNLDEFECPVCLDRVASMEGVIPKNCGEHHFCKGCLSALINNSDTALVNCPAEGCDALLQDREVQMLVSKEEHQALLSKGLKHAIAQAMQCLTPDCEGAWFISSEGDGRFHCPQCDKLNCSKCKVIHENKQSCQEYQADLAIRRQNELSEDESKKYLTQRLKDGFAMVCPKCQAIVEKVDGCDGILCTVCRTELCWATKGLRWGPGGKGDWEGGGCRCMVGGKRCTPQCQNCH